MYVQFLTVPYHKKWRIQTVKIVLGNSVDEGEEEAEQGGRLCEAAGRVRGLPAGFGMRTTSYSYYYKFSTI